MNEGLVAKNSHSNTTQAVPLTRTRLANREVFILFEYGDNP